jgi:DNA-binding NarL/FixJ family response regulator
MDELPNRAPEELLRSTVSSLEAEYQAFRRAADRYHARAESGFQLVMHLLTESHIASTEKGGGAPPAKGPVEALGVNLTTRETQILKLIAAGHSTKQAAFLLGIRFKTAVGHRAQLMKKLQIHDTASLVRFAIRAGLVDP